MKGEVDRMGDFVSSIYIESFRGIEKLQLDALLPINILTGDNNSGKTSVLEVLQSFQNFASFSLWRKLIRKDVKGSRSMGMSYYEGFYDLFNINSEDKKIDYTIKYNGSSSNVVLMAEEVVEEIDENQLNTLQGMHLFSNASDRFQEVSKLEMKVLLDGKEVSKDSIYEGQVRFSSSFNRNMTGKKIVYISPVRHADGDVFLSSVLNHPDLYQQMLEILKEFDEDIISINYDNDSNHSSGKGVYKILSKSHNKALPLNVYGDGMKKAVLLMSAVIAARGGILLLDEFETAIHTSAMDKIFKWILNTCIELNVQLFLTSHSKEAIEKVLKCAPELWDKIALYTLYKDEEGSSVRRLTGSKAIEVQDNMGLELR